MKSNLAGHRDPLPGLGPGLAEDTPKRVCVSLLQMFLAEDKGDTHQQSWYRRH